MKISKLHRHLLDKFFGDSRDSQTPERETASPWISSLRDASEMLGALEIRTERDFLEIGERLQDFHRQSQEMADMASHVLGLMTGEDFHRSIKALADIIEDLGCRLRASREHFGRISQIFRQYYDTLHFVSSSMEGFKALVLNLRMLGFFTRVENAHLFSDESGFSSLTDDVKKLSESVKEKSTSIKDKSDELLAAITTTLSAMSASQKSQSSQTDIMLQHIASNHKILSRKTENALGGAELIAQSTGGITESIGDIVLGLQFHDITRQQIAHVREALEGVAQDMETGERPLAELAGITADICSLQTLQLSQSQEEFVRAVKNIQENLGRIARSVEEIVNETNTVTWASGSAGMSFMEEIDSGISAVIAALDQDIAERSRLTATIKSASGMVSDMSHFVKEIEELGLNLQLIALNARIKAAHIGSEGAALDTISGSIYELSKNSRSDTLVLSDTLSEIGELALGFDKDLEEIQQDQQQQVERLMNSLKSIIASLHEINGNILAVTADMNSQGKSLAEDITEMIGGITVHDKVKETLTEVRDMITRVADHIAEAFPDHDKSAAAAYLEALDKRYTMESERDIHFKHLERKSEQENYSPDRLPRGDLGDNVELF